MIVCALSFECKAEIVCIHPIPLTIKELAEKEKTGVISHQVAQLNASYLISKYCDKVTEPLKAVSSVSLGGECEMEWGHRLGETVYWATCMLEKSLEKGLLLPRRPVVCNTTVENNLWRAGALLSVVVGIFRASLGLRKMFANTYNNLIRVVTAP